MDKILSFGVSVSAAAAMIPFGACSPIEREKTGNSESTKPNILIVLADDCTCQDIGCYGSGNGLTPNIDALAESGLKFNRAYCSSSMSTPVRHSLYTGLYPIRHGGYANHGTVREEIKSLPHYLKEAGYRVGLAGKWDVRPEENFPFENVHGFPSNCVSADTDYTLGGAFEFVNRNDDQPFCLVVASINSHVPYTAGDYTKIDAKKIVLPDHIADTENSRKKYAMYLAEISALDRQVGDLVTMLKSAGKMDNTLIIFLSEQGAQMPASKWSLYEPGVKSAMIVAWPGVVEAGSETNALVQYEDMVPTLVDIAGSAPPDNLDGFSFKSVLSTPSNPGDRKYAFYVHNNVPEGPAYPIRAVSDGQFKLIWNLSYENEFDVQYLDDWKTDWKRTATEQSLGLLDRLSHRPKYELYNLAEDKTEMENLYGREEYSDIITNLKYQLEQWMLEQNDLGKVMDKSVF